MSETQPQTTSESSESSTKKPSRVKVFIATHPRIARAAKLTAAGLALVMVTRVVTNAQHNKARLDDAKEHAGEALDAVTDSVTLNTEA